MFVCSSILYEWDAACMLGVRDNTVGYGKGIYRQGKTGWWGQWRRPEDLQSPQQLQVSADGLARSFLSSFIGSGNSLYNSTSVSWKQTQELRVSFTPHLPAFHRNMCQTGLIEKCSPVSLAVTCLRALRAIVWKACSTLIASLALVSKYGMLFLLWHQAWARLVVTWNTKESMLYLETSDCFTKPIFKTVPLL